MAAPARRRGPRHSRRRPRFFLPTRSCPLDPGRASAPSKRRYRRREPVVGARCSATGLGAYLEYFLIPRVPFRARAQRQRRGGSDRGRRVRARRDDRHRALGPTPPRLVAARKSLPTEVRGRSTCWRRVQLAIARAARARPSHALGEHRVPLAGARTRIPARVVCQGTLVAHRRTRAPAPDSRATRLIIIPAIDGTADVLARHRCAQAHGGRRRSDATGTERSSRQASAS